VMAAKQRGERLPPGWALDEKGQPTSDPDAALRGTMLPAGDAKGIALALMVELMAAGMIGANYATEASSYLDAEGAPSGTGQLLIAFDPAAFGNHAIGRFGVLAVAIESQQGARLPGERRLALRAKAKAEGVTISDKLMEEIEAA
jgi:(2R)-3-sulfolactate dehydrogenase (NADP+)